MGGAALLCGESMWHRVGPTDALSHNQRIFYTSNGKRDSADVTKSPETDNGGSSGWTRCHLKGPFKREMSQKRRWDYVTKTEVRVTWLLALKTRRPQAEECR